VILNLPQQDCGRRHYFEVSFAQLHHSALEILKKTTLGEIKSILGDHAIITDATPLMNVIVPIIEVLNVYALQHPSTAVLCGPDLVRFWDFGNNKLGITPLVFQIPVLRNIDGTKANPEDCGKTISLSCVSRSLAEKLLNGATDKVALLQIYSLFIMKLPEEIRGDVSIKIGNMDLNLSHDGEVIKKLDSQVSTDILARDLIERLPRIMETISRRI
jgi:hypothetical protein